ncbi:MAG: hypothetical protein ACRDD7_08380 [Peptostreptococcaceae bacterium]
MGLELDKVEKYFDEQNINYTITSIQGKKDQDKLIIARVIKISQLDDNNVEILITNFSDSLK